MQFKVFIGLLSSCRLYWTIFISDLYVYDVTSSHFSLCIVFYFRKSLKKLQCVFWKQLKFRNMNQGMQPLRKVFSFVITVSIKLTSLCHTQFIICDIVFTCKNTWKTHTKSNIYSKKLAVMGHDSLPHRSILGMKVWFAKSIVKI